MPKRHPKKSPPKKPLSNYPMTVKIFLTCLALVLITNHFPIVLDKMAMTLSHPLGLLTYQFVHVNWMHFAGNFIFGLPFLAYLESRIGSSRLLTWYLLFGALSALFFLALQSLGSGLIGASGSLSGIAMASCLKFKGRPLERIIAAWVGLSMLSFQILYALWDNGFSGVAYWGHVGGMVAAIIIVLGDQWMPSVKLSR